MIVGVLDYSAGGNIYSMEKAVSRLDVDVRIVKGTRGIDKLIIPGVGTYAEGSRGISEHKDEIIDFAQNHGVLGVCLGMQLLGRKGFEYGEHDGLGLVSGECVAINTSKALPHLGWSKVNLMRESKLLKGVEKESFYFMHSYEVINYTDSVALSDYGNHTFVSVLEKDNVYGVQFHPEKSRDAGLRLLDNFIKAD